MVARLANRIWHASYRTGSSMLTRAESPGVPTQGPNKSPLLNPYLLHTHRHPQPTCSMWWCNTSCCCSAGAKGPAPPRSRLKASVLARWLRVCGST